LAIYVAYIFSVYYVGARLLREREFPRVGKRIYTILMGTALFLISALRAETVGTDIPGYISKFKVIPDYDISSIMTIDKDSGFYVFIKLLSFINTSPRFHLVVIAAIFAISVSVFIYRYSEEPAFSFFALLPLTFFYFSMTGLRQTLAFCVLLFAYPFIIGRKPLHFFALVIFAAAFHKTALVFSLAYLASYIKWNWKTVIVVTVGFIAIYLARYYVVLLLLFALPERGYGVTDAGGGFTTLIMYLGIFLFTLIFGQGIKNDSEYYPMYFILVLGMVFQMMTPMLNEMFRLALYFNVYVIVFLPTVIRRIKDRNLGLDCYMGAVCCLGVLYFVFTYADAGVYPYHFFWQP